MDLSLEEGCYIWAIKRPINFFNMFVCASQVDLEMLAHALPLRKYASYLGCTRPPYALIF